MIRLYDAKPHHCRAIVGHDTDGIVFFCGETTTFRQDGLPSSWCKEHHALYRQPPAPPTRRRGRLFVFKRKPVSLLSTADG
jgi:hypothetical protein